MQNARSGSQTLSSTPYLPHYLPVGYAGHANNEKDLEAETKRLLFHNNLQASKAEMEETQLKIKR